VTVAIGEEIGTDMEKELKEGVLTSVVESWWRLAL